MVIPRPLIRLFLTFSGSQIFSIRWTRLIQTEILISFGDWLVPLVLFIILRRRVPHRIFHWRLSLVMIRLTLTLVLSQNRIPTIVCSCTPDSCILILIHARLVTCDVFNFIQRFVERILRVCPYQPSSSTEHFRDVNVSIFQNSSFEALLSFLVDNISIVISQESHLVNLLAVVIKQHILLVLALLQNRLA